MGGVIVSSCTILPESFLDRLYDLNADGPIVGSTSVSLISRDYQAGRLFQRVLIEHVDPDAVEVRLDLKGTRVKIGDDEWKPARCREVGINGSDTYRMLRFGERVIIECWRESPKGREGEDWPTHRISIPWSSNSKKGAIELALITGEDTEQGRPHWDDGDESWLLDVLVEGAEGGATSSYSDSPFGSPVALSKRCGLVTEMRLFEDEDQSFLVAAVRNTSTRAVTIDSDRVQILSDGRAVEATALQKENRIQKLEGDGRRIFAWTLGPNENLKGGKELKAGIETKVGDSICRVDLRMTVDGSDLPEESRKPEKHSPWMGATLVLQGGPRSAFGGNLREYTGNGSTYSAEFVMMNNGHHGFGMRYGFRVGGEVDPARSISWAGKTDASNSAFVPGIGYLFRPFSLRTVDLSLGLGASLDWTVANHANGERADGLIFFLDQSLNLDFRLGHYRTSQGRRDYGIRTSVIHSWGGGSWGDNDSLSGHSVSFLIGGFWRLWRR